MDIQSHMVNVNELFECEGTVRNDRGGKRREGREGLGMKGEGGGERRGGEEM